MSTCIIVYPAVVCCLSYEIHSSISSCVIAGILRCIDFRLRNLHKTHAGSKSTLKNVDIKLDNKQHRRGKLKCCTLVPQIPVRPKLKDFITVSKEKQVMVNVRQRLSFCVFPLHTFDIGAYSICEGHLLRGSS